MKIAYLAFSATVPSSVGGGMYVHTIEICRNMADLGVNVILFARKGRADASIKGIKVSNVRFPLGLKGFADPDIVFSPLDYIETMGELKYVDLIHERLPFGIDPFGLLLTRRAKCPKVLELNFPLLRLLRSPFRSVRRKLYEVHLQSFSAIITQTESLKRIIQQDTDVPVYVVPNGVDVELFHPRDDSCSLRKNHGFNDDDVVITLVGTFYEWHGIDQIPIIAEAVDKLNKKVKFLLVGGHTRYFTRFQRNMPSNLKRDVILVGPQRYEDIPMYLALSDILIAPFDATHYPYIEEMGFWWCPIKLFEYMASGKPIVSYDFHEVRKITKHSAFLAKPGNFKQFINCILALIEDEGLRNKLGAEARSIAEREYSWKRRAEETVRVYNSIC